MRKRRNRGNWIPVLGHRDIQGENEYAYSDFYIDKAGLNVLPSGAQGGAQFGPIPIVPDFSLQQDAPGTDGGASLHDRVSGNAWMLSRIVGKAHFQCVSSSGEGPATAWPNILLTMGFFVARSDDQNQGLCDITGLEADPTQVDNATNPWIWRRSWILGSPASAAVNSFPFTTAGYGSVADGPHIDSKVKRFIPREHRLWWVVNARGYSPDTLTVDGDIGEQPSYGGILDLRIYGALRRQRNTSSF